MINVIDKPCEHFNCKTQPHFNYEGESKRRFCVKHKLDGMISLTNNFCQYPNCKTLPIYNYDGEESGGGVQCIN